MERYFQFDRFKSLNELLGLKENGQYFESNLVVKCMGLMKKKINDYEIEDLRTMIGQEIGLDYLVPLALENLEGNIFLEGDLYPGDLLDSVLRVSEKFWERNPHCKDMLKAILRKNINSLKEKFDSLT